MQFKNRLFIVSFIFAFMMLFQGCKDTYQKYYEEIDKTTLKDKILSEMEKLPNISKFTEAVSQVDSLEELLEQSRLYTVFAPTNDAYDKIDTEVLNNPILFERMIKYHFINGKFKNKDIIEGDIKTFNKKSLNFSFEDESNEVLIDTNAKLIETDFLTQNGMIHVIDEALIPLNNLYESLQYNDYSKILGDEIPNYAAKEFDKALSTPIGINKNGKTVYDSVFNITNPLLYKLNDRYRGEFYSNLYFRYIDIEEESDLFTMIVPTNFSNALTVVNSSNLLNSKISNKNLSGPILSNMIFKGIYDEKTLRTDFIFDNSIPDIDTSQIELYFETLLRNNYNKELNLSNGIIHEVDSFEYDLSWLIKEQANNRYEIKESDYLDTLKNNILDASDSILNKSTISLLNLKTYFYFQDTLLDTLLTSDLEYEDRYGDYANFTINGEFYPVDYKVMLRGKNAFSGKYKVETEGQEIATYDFETAPSGDNDTKFDEIGIVSFTETKYSTDLKFTFVETHSGAGLSKNQQILWIREIKLVPILE